MTQFQENAWTDGRTDRPYFIGHFDYCQGSKKKHFFGSFFKFLNKHLHQIIGQSKLQKLNTFHGANSK